MQLTQKESSLLKDLKEQEQLCVKKYTDHSSSASDPQLKNLFSSLARVEEGHYQTICGMESGTLPSGASGSGVQMTFTESYTAADQSEAKKQDAFFCSDVLATEKHVSHLYDTAIFEFTDEQARQALNGIQKQEQGHGKLIYDYMSKNNMQA